MSIPIFLSYPKPHMAIQQKFIEAVQEYLKERGMEGRTLGQNEYPENRDTTPEESSGPIPLVEVCHVGPIPVSAVSHHLLVRAEDFRRFKTLEAFDESALAQIEAEYARS